MDNLLIFQGITNVAKMKLPV